MLGEKEMINSIARKKRVNSERQTERNKQWGKYWHRNPMFFPSPTDSQKEQIEEDKIRSAELTAMGMRVLRLGEYEINAMTIDTFKSKLGVIV